MRRNLTAAFTITLAVLGLAAGLFAFPARADNPQGARSIEDLQALGYVIGARANLSVSPCTFFYVISANGVPFADGQEPVIEFNADPSKPECRTPDAEIQANIDALLAAYPPAPPVTTTAATETAPAPTETAPEPVTTTVDSPPVTEPTPADTASASALTAAVAAGATDPAAALAARSAGENALLGL